MAELREFRDSFESVLHEPLLFSCAHCYGPCKVERMGAQIAELTDRVDGLQQRLDRFHEWAEVLQREFRSLHKRQRSMVAESKATSFAFDFRPSSDSESSKRENQKR